MESKIGIKVAETDWLYGNVKTMTMQIYKLNYDYWYDMNEGYHMEGETENLNENNEQYVLFNNSPTFEEITEFPFHTSLDLEEAKNYAEKTVEQKLNWRS